MIMKLNLCWMFSLALWANGAASYDADSSDLFNFLNIYDQTESNCKFNLSQHQILKAKESLAKGAKNVGQKYVSRPDDCYTSCCQNQDCSVALTSKADGQSSKGRYRCFLMKCGSAFELCEFTKSENFTVAMVGRVHKENTPDLFGLPEYSQASMTTVETQRNLDSVANHYENHEEKTTIKTPPPQQCNPLQYRCKEVKKGPYCVAKYNVCDGVVNCEDASDESGCVSSDKLLPSARRTEDESETNRDNGNRRRNGAADLGSAVSSKSLSDRTINHVLKEHKDLINELAERLLKEQHPSTGYHLNPVENVYNRAPPPSRHSVYMDDRPGPTLSEYYGASDVDDGRWPSPLVPMANSFDGRPRGKGPNFSVLRPLSNQLVDWSLAYPHYDNRDDYYNYYDQERTTDDVVPRTRRPPRRKTPPSVDGPVPARQHKLSSTSPPVQLPVSSAKPVPPAKSDGPNGKKDSERTSSRQPTTALPPATRRLDTSSRSSVTVGYEPVDDETVQLDTSYGTIVVVLAAGLLLTFVLLVFVSCRLRQVRTRLRRGKALHGSEADYLINGMYL